MSIKLNAKPLEDFGLDVVRPLTGWNDYPAVSLELLDISGAAGKFASAYGVTVDPRGINIRVKVKPATLAGRKAALSTIYQAFGGQLVSLSFDDDPTREVFAILLQGEAGGAGPNAPELVDPDAVVALQFLAPDPFYYDVQIWSRAFGIATPTTIPLGDAGARLELLIFNITTVCTVTVKSGRTGATLYTITLTGAITSSQWLRVIFSDQKIRVVAGNPYTETDAYNRKGSTEVWPRFDPRDQPTIEISQGDALMVGKRAYQV